MSDQSEFGATGFADPTRAIRMRDAIRNIAEQEVGKLTASQQVARVISINFSNYTADVWIPGDPEPIRVNMFEDLIPGATTTQGFDNQSVQETSTTGTGSIVVIDKVGGKLYIVRVLSGGQFASRLGAAGFVHKSMNALPISDNAPPIWKQSAVVSGNYGLEVSLFAPANGQAVMIGPFVATKYGSFSPGTIRVTVTRFEDTAVFESIIDPKQIERSSPTGPTRWKRLLPQMRGSIWRNQTMQCDVGYRSTSYRDKTNNNELWVRISDLAEDADFSYIHIEAFGPMITFGDVDTGRILIEQVDIADYNGADGYLGFHDSFFLFRGREKESGATGPYVPSDGSTWTGASGHSGGWHSGPRIMSSQLRETWACDGTMTWTGSKVSWTGNLVFGGIGSGLDTLPEGTLQVPMPATGLQVPILPSPYTNPSNYLTTIDAGGITLAAGQTLYYGIPPGMMNTGSLSVATQPHVTANYFTNWHNKTWMFFIVTDTVNAGYMPSFAVPEWAIPICSNKGTSHHNEFQVYSYGTAVYDQTKHSVNALTTTLSSIAANTETVIHTLPSFKFKNGCAYIARLKVGYQVNNSAANNGMPHFRIRKGTATSGNDWGEYLRAPAAPNLGQVMGFYSELYLANTSGADVNTQIVATVNFVVPGTVPTPAPTLNIYANSTTKRYLEVEYAGPASKYSAHAAAIS